MRTSLIVALAGVVTSLKITHVFTAVALRQKSLFAASQQLDSDEREAIYAGMVFDLTGWQYEKIISVEPLAVIMQWDSKDKQRIATIRVWTGFLTRDEDDLLTSWDELWIGADGRVTKQRVDKITVIENYFGAVDQTNFRVKAQLGYMPWIANIPTDLEAAAKGLAIIPQDGSFNLYNIRFTIEPGLSASPSVVRLEQDVPAVVVDEVIPRDAMQHWAKIYIIDLLQKGIIQGDEDALIRPDNTLTRAEFAVLLSKALKTLSNDAVNQLDKTVNVIHRFADLKGHWSELMIQPLLNQKIIRSASDDHQFYPNQAITRIEMVEWVSAVLKNRGWFIQQSELFYLDMVDLSLVQKQALALAVKAEIVTQPSDISFRPHDLLTRAESFKVVSNLIMRSQPLKRKG